MEIARLKGLALIEDCAHALGSTYQGRKVGTFGDAAFFSSQWSKPYSTGLGGIAVTSNPEIAAGLRRVQSEFVEPPLGSLFKLRTQYSIHHRLFHPRVYWLAVDTLRVMSKLGLFVGSSGRDELNREMPSDTRWRMSSYQAVLGIKQLKRLERDLSHRGQLVSIYEENLKAANLYCNEPLENKQAAYLRYPLQVNNKREILRKAHIAGIELGSWFQSVLHPIQGSLDRFDYNAGHCPIGERTAQTVINLPLHPRVSFAGAEKIVEFVIRHSKPVPSKFSEHLQRARLETVSPS
jgi:dTDP-4-amino-4,6-dideoxygalactose transaminase